jgi:hypothetical protein
MDDSETKPEPPPKLRKSDTNKIFEAQLIHWAERNRAPGVLPCVPIILISALTGDKPGITIQLAPNLKLDHIKQVLLSAADQVQMKIKEVGGN